MYDISVPVFIRQLNAMAAILGRTIPFLAEKRIEPAALLQTRLYPNMYPFWLQLNRQMFHSQAVVSLLARREQVLPGKEESTLEAYQAQYAQSIAYLKGITPSELVGSEEREIVFTRPAGTTLRMKGRDLLIHFAFPNFYFHTVTGYDILRSIGLDVGKRDYIGAAPFLPD